MKVFISGGCKNGKSFEGQQIAVKISKEKNIPLYYIATMKPKDDEDLERIKRHKDERKNQGFQTIEQYKSIEKALDKIEKNSVVFLDSVTALLENEMFDENYNMDKMASQRVIYGLNALFEKINDIVFISDYIYGDGIQYDESTEFYRKELASVDRWLCNKCDRVLEVVFGKVTEYKEHN